MIHSLIQSTVRSQTRFACTSINPVRYRILDTRAQGESKKKTGKTDDPLVVTH